MAQKRTRRRFAREFKAQAVKRLLESGRGLSEVATELGVGTAQLSAWRSEYLAAGTAEALAARRVEQACAKSKYVELYARADYVKGKKLGFKRAITKI
jgi:transposase-like protein